MRQCWTIPGTLHRFYGNGCRHFTVPNTTDITRVSLDLRVVPGPLYDNDFEGSRHKVGGRRQDAAFALCVHYLSAAFH